MAVTDNRKTRVCYVLSYRAPDYIRTKNIVSALSSLDYVDLVVVKNTNPGVMRYMQTLLWFGKVFFTTKPDLVVIGFRGVEIYPLIRMFMPAERIVLDAMMSPSASMMQERGWISLLVGKYILLPIERWIMRDCRMALTDTELHVEFYAEHFHIDKSKLVSVPVSADESVSLVRNNLDKKLVLFYGSFLPLHGFSVILEAMSRVTCRDVSYCFIGLKGKNRDLLHLFTRNNPDIDVDVVSYVPFNTLMNEYVAKTWLFLAGPFGGTPQATRVVTGKAAQALFLGIPVVIGEIDIKPRIVDKQHCMVVEQADPVALAKAIDWACNNDKKLQEMTVYGRAYYEEYLSLSIVTGVVDTFMRKLCA